MDLVHPPQELNLKQYKWDVLTTATPVEHNTG